MYLVEFAPDGKNFFQIEKGNVDKMWDYFNFNAEIRKQLAVNKFAKFRLIGDKGKLIGELPRDNLRITLG